MNESEKLKLYMEKLQLMAAEKVKHENKSAIVALKESIYYIEGEMLGY